MKININNLDDWEELDELPLKEKIFKKKKKDKKKIDEDLKENDIYDKEGDK